MKKQFLFLCIIVTLGISCSQNRHLQVDPKDYPLAHIVLLDTKDDANIEEVLKVIKKIEGIEVLKNLEVGVFQALGDVRAMSEYEVILKMQFANEADYQQYQKHPLHLALKKNLAAYLSGPPVTYDYIITI